MILEFKHLQVENMKDESFYSVQRDQINNSRDVDMAVVFIHG